jgi:hypothetical protein
MERNVLGNFNIFVPQQYRNILDRHTCQQQLDAEGIPEPVSVPIGHSSEVKKLFSKYAAKCQPPYAVSMFQSKRNILAESGNRR